ncbi:MAG: hypothetical protein ACLRVT_07245, partial [Oscillospiraceae bacterium]
MPQNQQGDLFPLPAEHQSPAGFFPFEQDGSLLASHSLLMMPVLVKITNTFWSFSIKLLYHVFPRKGR